MMPLRLIKKYKQLGMVILILGKYKLEKYDT